MYDNSKVNLRRWQALTATMPEEQKPAFRDMALARLAQHVDADDWAEAIMDAFADLRAKDAA